jgi:peptidoglycan/LPS O-acetylase OafA/YrhL
MVHHFAISNMVLNGGRWDAPPEHYLNNLGRTPVTLFFIITGFLFYPTIESGLRATNWFAFYTKRFLRIAPLMWLALTFVIGTAFIFSPARTVSMESVIDVARWATFTGMPDLFGFPATKLLIAGAAWSLTWEWGYYLSVFPAAVVASKIPIKPFVLVYAVSGLAVLGVEEIYPNLLPHIAASIILFSTLFALGMSVRIFRSVLCVRRLAARTWPAVATALLLLVIIFTVANPFSVLQCLCSAVLFVFVAADNKAFRLLSSRDVVALGEASYSLYLLHGLLLYLYFHTLAGIFSGSQWIWASLPIVTAVITAVALTAHKVFEVPFMELGKRLSAKRAQTAPDATRA